MNITLATYGRQKPKLEVRLCWGVGETWPEACDNEQKNAQRLGIPVPLPPFQTGKDGWAEWARGGFVVSSSEYNQATMPPSALTEEEETPLAPRRLGTLLQRLDTTITATLLDFNLIQKRNADHPACKYWKALQAEVVATHACLVETMATELLIKLARQPEEEN